MKKFILDTDMGVDCDDAVALALLINYKKAGACDILGVTASSTREGATATIRTICEGRFSDRGDGFACACLR